MLLTKNLHRFSTFIFMAILWVNCLMASATQDSLRINLNQEQSSRQQIEVYLPENFSNGHIPVPRIDADTSSGEIEITFNSINLSPNKKQQFSTNNNKPLSLVLFFRDNNQLQIVGKTTKFENISGFYSFDDHKYTFDITYSKPDSKSTLFQKKENIALNTSAKTEKKQNTDTNLVTATSQKSQSSSLTPSSQNKPASSSVKSQNSESQILTILSRAVKSALLVAFVILFLISATILVIKVYSGQNLLKPYLKELRQNWKSGNKQPQKSKEDTQPEPEEDTRIPINRTTESASSASQFQSIDNKVAEIQKIMEKKGLSYDEAELYYNMNQSNFNA
ncbi:MAG TPA: hypothetical protein VKP78_09465 [bacterium]|nr:hypothetical protein [bacterium]